MNVYRAVSELKPARIWDGVLARALHADRLVTEHRHDHEQVGFVLRGSVTMVIAGQSRELRVGETYTIASQVPHSARAGGDGASVVDVFAPVREEWKAAPMLEPFPGRWPETSR